ncbi:inner centromere protein A isoform X5 [Acanthochromis polyacanthus]|uniref:inner centromere protein A isoform X5 n=1 Tax=Acanthochromis polyacanthus TaxID=80966 RepID=UPI002234279A|nr:inner centromere protein A isoform X5 [Acanthochromis polyacanthus]
MNSMLSSVRSLMEMFDGKAQEFISEIDNVHMVWLEEIQQEANRMFSRDFNAEPELMPKTPSQKKNSRRKRVSVGRQEENQARRRFSKGRRSNLRGSGTSVKSLNLIAEEENIPEPSTSEANSTTQPKRTTRKKQKKPEVAEDVSLSPDSSKTEEVLNKKPELVEEEDANKENKANNAEVQPDDTGSAAPSPPKIPSPEVVVSISPAERLSAELAKNPVLSPGRTAAKIAIAGTSQSSRRSSVRCSLNLRRSRAGLRHSMTQESVRRASRRSMLKKKAARMGNSTCSSSVGDDSSVDTADEKDDVVEDVPADTVDNAVPEKLKETPEIPINQHVGRITRSVAANSPTLAPPSLSVFNSKMSTPSKKTAVAEKQQMSQAVRRSSRSTKRKAPDTVEESPTKRFSPPKKSQSAIRPNMRSFLHTVQKNQMLMMTPNSLGRTAVIKSFIKHTTPLKADPKLSSGIVTKERHKLEALKKKMEQEEERMKKMEEEKKRKQDELKRKRDERLKRVFEAKVKEEQREEEKKKKIEQKMAQIDEKNDKRQAEEKAKKKVTLKRLEEQEQKKKLEEEAKKKKIQQAEEEKRQLELLAKKKAEEEEQRARKLAEARKALELKREQERELERERQAAAERERVEKEKAIALQRELERAAREKEIRELEQRRKALEEKRKLEEQQRLAAKEKALKETEAAKLKEATQTRAALNMTVDIERSVLNTPVGKGGGINVVDCEQSSPQSYVITPKGNNKPLITSKSLEDYGMDQNSDDSTDDESAPRKAIPSWAEGPNLQQIIMKQYFNPPDLDSFFGIVEPPKLESIFYKSKPRYFKRTSSAVWNSPPGGTK